MKMLKFLKWQNTLIFFLMIAVVLLLFNGSVSAAETPLKVYKNNDQIKVTNYSVVPVFANNQDKNKAGYWHVKLSPKKDRYYVLRSLQVIIREILIYRSIMLLQIEIWLLIIAIKQKTISMAN